MSGFYIEEEAEIRFLEDEEGFLAFEDVFESLYGQNSFDLEGANLVVFPQMSQEKNKLAQEVAGFLLGFFLRKCVQEGCDIFIVDNETENFLLGMKNVGTTSFGV